jgi:hypothetical protein
MASMKEKGERERLYAHPIHSEGYIVHCDVPPKHAVNMSVFKKISTAK